MSSRGGFICLACGSELPEPLRLTASLRCHDCRELNAPLRVEHAHGERARLRQGEREGARLQALLDAA
jgi:hypothetical protein